MWDSGDTQGNESSKIKYEIVSYTRGRGLDLGCGMWKAFPHFIGVDSMKQWKNMSPSDEMAMLMSVDVVCNCEKLSLFSSESMDFVFSSHLLEHIENTYLALKEWWRVIKPDGYLVLYLPHKNFYPNIGQPGANEDHKHDFTPADIIIEMKKLGGWDLVRNEERNQDKEYSFFQVFRKRRDKEQNHLWDIDKGKTAAVVRYGGFGDMVQAASIFPQLKSQGYHVTLFTTVRGYQIAKSDPNIDEFYLQDDDQVRNEELVPFWKCHEAKYDKWINLSESVEGTFLALPGRTAATWPKHVRDVMLNKNYLEFTHLLAGLPFDPKPKFYATNKERKKALKRLNKYSENNHYKVILWTLSGSSVHKVWPWMDQAIARILLTHSDVKIVFTGEELCQTLENDWRNEDLIIRRSGVWNIREALAFSEVADMVIGQETGVMNAVSMLDIPKIIFMSHSSMENLTRDWPNCISLIPENCPCWPCHKMHYGFASCNRDEETGTALCQARISFEQFMDAFNTQIRKENGYVREL